MSAPTLPRALPMDLTGALPDGTWVLEASAGTGKTYTIAGLVSRYVAEGTPLHRVLATPSSAATGELRTRVRDGCCLHGSWPAVRVDVEGPGPAAERRHHARWRCADTAGGCPGRSTPPRWPPRTSSCQPVLAALGWRPT